MGWPLRSPAIAGGPPQGRAAGRSPEPSQCLPRLLQGSWHSGGNEWASAPADSPAAAHVVTLLLHSGPVTQTAFPESPSHPGARSRGSGPGQGRWGLVSCRCPVPPTPLGRRPLHCSQNGRRSTERCRLYEHNTKDLASPRLVNHEQLQKSPEEAGGSDRLGTRRRHPTSALSVCSLTALPSSDTQGAGRLGWAGAREGRGNRDRCGPDSSGVTAVGWVRVEEGTEGSRVTEKLKLKKNFMSVLKSRQSLYQKRRKNTSRNFDTELKYTCDLCHLPSYPHT